MVMIKETVSSSATEDQVQDLIVWVTEWQRTLSA